MRYVVNRDEVAHLWAHQAQNNARVQGNNFYFEGKNLYSYGRHFVVAAHLADGRVIINSSTYGPTTSKHQWAMEHALTGQQRREALRVPGLTEDNLRQLESLRAAPSRLRRTVPDLAQDCAKQIQTLVASMLKMRPTAHRIQGVFYNAKKLETAGLAVCEYVKKGNSKPKWPIPKLPKDLPQGDDLKAMIKLFGKAELIKEYNGAVANLKHKLAFFQAEVDSPECRYNYNIQNYKGSLNSTWHLIKTANSAYKGVYGKNSAVVAKLQKELEILEPKLLAVYDKWVDEAKTKDLRDKVEAIYRVLRDRDDHRSNSFSYSADRLQQVLMESSDEVQESYAPLLRRARAVADWLKAEANLEIVKLNVQAAEDSKASHKLRLYNQTFTILSYRVPEQFAQLHQAKIADLLEQAISGAKLAQAGLEEENAEVIANWINGTSNQRPPYELGTYARINGDKVETTQSASVPLEHAARLARLYAIGVRRGGEEWPDGSGPMVGYYRVNKIGADGSLVIGCHSFNPNEARRLQNLLTPVAA